MPRGYSRYPGNIGRVDARGACAMSGDWSDFHIAPDALLDVITQVSTGIQISPVAGIENSPPWLGLGLLRTDETGFQFLL